MANDIANKLIVTAKTQAEIEDFLKAIEGEENGKKIHIDFERIIPMPEALQFTKCGSEETDAIYYFLITTNKENLVNEILRFPQFYSMEKYINKTKAEGIIFLVNRRNALPFEDVVKYTRSFELLNKMEYVRTGGSKEELQCANMLKEECEKQGLTLCASTHRAEHYFFMNMGRTFDSDVNDEAYADFYGPAVYCKEFHSGDLHKYTADTYSRGASKEWLEDWLVRTCEIIDRYQPSVLYFDWWIHNHSFKPYLKKLAAYYYNRAEEWGKEVTINYKHEAFPQSVATFDIERGAQSAISPWYWQTDTAIGKRSWGYRTDNEYKSARQVICDLVDIVSKNGNLLINIGPRADGTITEEETKVLLTMGKWLEVNGEGIYGTAFWKQFGEGSVNAEDGQFKDNDEKAFTSEDFRFTFKDGYLYAFQMRPSETVRIKTLRKRNPHDFLVEEVELLGGGEISWQRTEKYLEIKPHIPSVDDLPVCFKISIG